MSSRATLRVWCVEAVDRTGGMLRVGVARIGEEDVPGQIQGHVVERVEAFSVAGVGEDLDALAVGGDAQEAAAAGVAGDQPSLPVDLQPVGLRLAAGERRQRAEIAEHLGVPSGAIRPIVPLLR